MFVKKLSLRLAPAIMTFLSSISYETLAVYPPRDLPAEPLKKDGELPGNLPTEPLRKGAGLPEKKGFKADHSWIRNPQKTAAQEAAEKAREEREGEMNNAINKMELRPSMMGKPELGSTRPEWQRKLIERRQERLRKEQPTPNPIQENVPEKAGGESSALPSEHHHQSPTMPGVSKHREEGSPTQGETGVTKPEIHSGKQNPPPPPVPHFPSPSVPIEPPAHPKPKASPSLPEQIQQRKDRLKPVNGSTSQSPTMNGMIQEQEEAKAMGPSPQQKPTASPSLLEQIRQGKQLRPVNESATQSPTMKRMAQGQEDKAN